MNLRRKYDGFASKGALQGVQRLAKAYWRDAYKRDLRGGALRGGFGDDADGAAVRELHDLLVDARCHVPGAADTVCTRDRGTKPAAAAAAVAPETRGARRGAGGGGGGGVRGRDARRDDSIKASTITC
ncbi:hypothetical protein JL721_11369 [Aureococcus anophagefferens]|nr:hypothetical protein JL721_11369 [Aureococcus anophagefferens]